MIEEREPIDIIEPKRYELVFAVPVARAIAQRGESCRGGFNQNTPTDVGALIHINEDGSVNVFTGRVEFGQDTRTTSPG